MTLKSSGEQPLLNGPQLVDEVRKQFNARFQSEPKLFRSPGRINLIGEHTDYNDGFVMPAAIDREIVVAVAPAGGPRSTVFAPRQEKTVTFDPANPEKVRDPMWANYLLGVAKKLTDMGYVLKPFDCVVDGNIPSGAGLSSSAALECSFAYALNELHGFNIPRIDLVHIAQWAEHHYVGVMCGIMDQFASMMGKEDHAFVLDCRSLDYNYFPVKLGEYQIILCDSMVKHALADSAYNTRRKECEEGVELLRQHYPAVRSLRDVTAEMLKEQQPGFPADVFDRCSYVVGENSRVMAAAELLRSGDIVGFGQKMYETHAGLSKLYQVSCEELDFLVDATRPMQAVLGSRMMGGGFGGCTINIVRKDEAGNFQDTIRQRYRDKFQSDMSCYSVALVDGSGPIQ
jgi:galactokinase